MADSVSVIQMTTAKEISVPMGIDALSNELSAIYFEPRVAPLWKVKDTQGRVHLINVNEIVHVEGPE
jgi:hypothetical protein